MESKYKVDGVALNIYCKEHQLNFRTQSNRIRAYIKAHPELSEEDAIKLALSKCGVHFETIKYWYNGISLPQYCREKNYNYASIVSRVGRVKKLNSSITDNEAVRIAIEEVNDFGIKYYYDGIPLVEYCVIHDEYNYISVVTYIRRKKAKFPDLDDQTIIDSYFAEEHVTHNHYEIDGLSLIDYCDSHDIIYGSILTALSKMRNQEKYKNLNDQERLLLILTNYKRPYLYYKGLTLAAYCREHDYSYNSVYNYAISLIKNDESVTYEQAIETALANIKRYGIKYYYKGIPLTQYCKEHGLPIKNVRYRILKNLNEKKLNLEEAIQETVDYSEKREHWKNIDNVFYHLNERENLTYEHLKKIIKYLKINYKNIALVKQYFYNIQDIITFIWYFHDFEKDQLISVSFEKIQEILLLSRSLPNIKEENIKDISLDTLIGIYKTHLFDTRYLIIKHQENYQYKVLLSLTKTYVINLNEDAKQDIIADANLFLLELLEKNYNNNIAIVIGYFNKSIKFFILRKLMSYCENTRPISLNTAVYKNENSKSEKQLIDTIKTPQTNDQFSDEIIKTLSSLDDLSKYFIYYKYYECCSDEELSKLLHMSLSELIFFEKNILSKLQKDSNLKKLIKK